MYAVSPIVSMLGGERYVIPFLDSSNTNLAAITKQVEWIKSIVEYTKGTSFVQKP